MELTDKVFGSASNKPKRLLHVDVFRENTVEEGGQDVELVNWPVKVCGDGDQNPYRLPPDNRGKGVEET